MAAVKSKLALSEAISSFLETDSAQKTLRSQKADARFFRIVLHFFDGHKIKFAADVGLEELQRFELWLAKPQQFGSESKEAWSQTSISLRFQTLKKFFRKLTAMRKIQHNPFELFHVERGESLKRRPMRPEEFQKIYALSPPYFKVVLAFMRFTGMRGAGVAALTWGDVDFERGQLMVKSRKGGVKRLKLTPFPLYPALRDLLMEQLANAQSDGTFKPTDPVFWGASGFPITAQDISTAGSRLIKRAGIQGVVLYGLRHAIAVELTEQGVPLEITRQAMGHSSLAQTSHYASGIASKSVADALEKIRKK